MTTRLPLRAAALALAAAAVLATGCGGDEGEPIASADDSPTTASAEATAAACADLEALVEAVVPGPPPDEDARAAALSRLAATGPEEIAGHAAALAGDSGAAVPSYEETAAALTALPRWAVTNCALDGPVWSCSARTGTESFAPITQEGVEPSPRDDVVASPEAATTGGDGERVEAGRAGDAVVFAWLDEHGLAVRSETVVRFDDGWSSDRTSQCDESLDGGGTYSGGDGFEDIGESVAGG